MLDKRWCKHSAVSVHPKRRDRYDHPGQTVRRVELSVRRRHEDESSGTEERIDLPGDWHLQHELCTAAAIDHVMRLQPDHRGWIETHLDRRTGTLVPCVNCCSMQIAKFGIFAGQREAARIRADTQVEEDLFGEDVLRVQLVLPRCNRPNPCVLKEYIVVQRSRGRTQVVLQALQRWCARCAW